MSKAWKNSMVKAISRDILLREEVVEAVLDRFLDLAVEEIVNEGEFKVHNLLSVHSSDYKGYKSGKGEVPPHRRLNLRLSSGVRRLFAHRNANPSASINRDNWREELRRLNSSARKSEKTPVRKAPEDDFFNPLIDED